jgi:3-oxoadipate enol-lactonase
MRIQANGISVNYESRGSGKCLTLIHGSCDNLNIWYNQVPAFSRHYRVLTYDVRGHGKTDMPERTLGISLWVSDLYALLNALGIRETILLGHSMGGSIAAVLATAHPAMVRALVLSNCSGGARRSKEKLRERDMRLGTQIKILESEGIGAFIQHRVSGLFTPGFEEKNTHAVEHYKQILSQTSGEGHIRVLQGMLQPADAADISKIACPTLIIEGEYDSLTTLSTAVRAQQAIRGAQLKAFPTGHATALEQPGAYNQTVLEFLFSAEKDTKR